jgi:hypothetical protein
VHPIAGSDELIVTRHRNHTGHDDRALQRAAASGELARLRSGASVATAVWRSLSPEDQRRLEAVAMAEMHPAFVASHRSAAALWRGPTIRRHDGLVQARVTEAAGSRTEHGVRKHAVRDAGSTSRSSTGSSAPRSSAPCSISPRTRTSPKRSSPSIGRSADH